MYVRPHQLSVSRVSLSGNSVRAVVSFVNPAGSSVKIDALAEGGKLIQAEISQEEYRVLRPLRDETLYLTPKDVTFCEYEI